MRTVRYAVAGLVIAASLVLTGTASAGWHHWRGWCCPPPACWAWPVPICYGGCWPMPCYPACASGGYGVRWTSPAALQPNMPQPQSMQPNMQPNTVPQPNMYNTPQVPGQQPVVPPGPGAPIRPTGALIFDVDVPATAQVFINDRPTKLTGAQRRYISQGVLPGLSYTYRVRVEVPGQAPETKTLQVRAGEHLRLSFVAPKAQAIVAN